MRVGVLKEVKPDEFRVSLTPAGARELVGLGHEVLVERTAGSGSGFLDEQYTVAGAVLCDGAEVWADAQLLLKVKEPVGAEYSLLGPGQTLFTYLHLAADRPLTEALVRSGATAVAYETVTNADGQLPLLLPMSEVAGRLAPQMGAQALERSRGGAGLLLSGVPGVPPARVVVLGGGVVGANCALIASGMRADVWVLDASIERLRYLESVFGSSVRLALSDSDLLLRLLPTADLVVGAVLVAGARAPRLLTREDLALMPPGSVLVDVAIDQGGCFETSRPTTHADPTYTVDGVVHYCVTNMPGAVPRTSTLALTNATLPFVRRLASEGITGAVRTDLRLASGVNVAAGVVTHQAVAEAHGLEFHSYSSLAA